MALGPPRSSSRPASAPPHCRLLPQANPHNYDAWFDYLRLVENDADVDTVREIYERAIANMPPIQEKRHWKRYIYLWINYALYEELEVKVSSCTHTRRVSPPASS